MDITSLFSGTPSQGVMALSAKEVGINITLAFVYGCIISKVYKETHKGTSYSRSLTVSIIYLSMLVAVVMMVIGTSLARAFGLVGALSIIRFRTVVKDPRDTAFVFYALAIGMACGTSNYLVAFLGVILVLFAILIVEKSNYGTLLRKDTMLQVVYSGDNDLFENIYKEVNGQIKKVDVVSRNFSKEMNRGVAIFNLRTRNEKNLEDVSKAILGMDGISEVNIHNTTLDVEF